MSQNLEYQNREVPVKIKTFTAYARQIKLKRFRVG